MQRVWLLNWENITYDYDLTNYLDAIISDWVIKWLDFQDWKITKWQAIIQISRDNWQKFFVHFENSEDLEIDLSRDWKVFIEINQDKINDWERNMEDWSWIWEIKVSDEMPEKNSLKLWYISGNSFFTDKKEIVLKNELLEKSGLTNLTKMWNEFNSAWKLLKLDEEWKIPNLDWSKITWIIPQVSSFDEEAIAGSDIEKWDLVWWKEFSIHELNEATWSNTDILIRSWNWNWYAIQEFDLEDDMMLSKIWHFNANLSYFVQSKAYLHIIEKEDNDDFSNISNFKTTVLNRNKVISQEYNVSNATISNVSMSFWEKNIDTNLKKWKYYMILDFERTYSQRAYCNIKIKLNQKSSSNVRVFYWYSPTINTSYQLPIKLTFKKSIPENAVIKFNTLSEIWEEFFKGIAKENALKWENFKYTKFWESPTKESLRMENNDTSGWINIWDWASYRKFGFEFSPWFYWFNKVFFKKLPDIWNFIWDITFKLHSTTTWIDKNYIITNQEWKNIEDDSDFMLYFNYFWLEKDQVYRMTIETSTQTSDGFIRLGCWNSLWSKMQNYNWSEWVDSSNFPKFKVIEELEKGKKYYLWKYKIGSSAITSFESEDTILLWEALDKNKIFFYKKKKEKKPIVIKSWNNHISSRTPFDIDIPIKWKPKKIKFYFNYSGSRNWSLTTYDVENWFIEWTSTSGDIIFWWSFIWYMYDIFNVSIKSLTENNIKINIYAKNSSTYYYKLALIY